MNINWNGAYWFTQGLLFCWIVSGGGLFLGLLALSIVVNLHAASALIRSMRDTP